MAFLSIRNGVIFQLLLTTAHCQCDPDRFATPAHTCQECRRCEFGEQFYLHACNSTRDAVCGNCTTCAEHEYEFAGCSETRDTVCTPCSPCALGATFELTACGPDSDADRVCGNCTRCEGEPCSLTHDAVCTLIVTILSLALTSDLPTLTPAMLASLGGALAAALDLPKTAVEALNDRRLRRLLTTELTARFRILAALTPLRLQAMDLVAIAKASGLPIVIRSVSTTPQATPPADDKSIVITLSIVGGVIGLMAFAAIVVYSMRSPDRVQDSFTDIVHIRAE